MKRVMSLTIILALSLFLGACASNETALVDKDGNVKENVAVESLYNEASTKMDAGEYKKAAKLFDEVERQYPYSEWASKSQLMSAFSQYKNLSYDEAVLALDRFIQLHPGDEQIAYAWYLKALCYYEQITDVRRDQKITELALDTLSQVTQRFLESEYARDAKFKIDLTLDHLAGKEMEIGRYYQKQGHYQAAIARYRKVIDYYQTTTQVPEALHRLVESYLALGILPEAEKAAAVLGYNFRGSKWYEDSYALLNGQPEKSSVYDRTLGKILN